MAHQWLQFSVRSLLVAMLLCAVGLRFWPSRDVDPPDSQWSELFDDNSPPLTNIPQVTVLSIDRSAARVNVKNVGDTTLQYYSRGPEHVQFFEERYTSGKWTQAAWDWCGTGMESFEIAPHNSAQLAVCFSSDEQLRERVLTYFLEKDTDRSGLVVLATKPDK